MHHGTFIFSLGVDMKPSDASPEVFSYGHDRLRFIRGQLKLAYEHLLLKKK